MKCLGAALLTCLLLAAPAQADFDEYELESASASLSTYQAGAHADFTTSIKIKAELASGDVAQTRRIDVELPPGLLGDPTAIPQCTMLQFQQNSCVAAAQVGVSEVLVRGAVPTLAPVYSLTPPGGDIVARFAFNTSLGGLVLINARVRSDGDYGVTAGVEEGPSVVALLATTTTFWGVPGSPVHDAERFLVNGTPLPQGGFVGLPRVPFLSNPTRCGVPLEVSVSAMSYQRPGVLSTKKVPLGPISGCGKLNFQPSFTASPTTSEAASPSGLDVGLKVPQDESPNGLASSHLRDATVSLPKGMTLAAGAADGLASCDAIQAAYKAAGPAGCPPASKLGKVELDVPGLNRPLQGAVYQRTPEPGNLFRVWIIADDLGIHVSLPGEIALDPNSGRVTTSFLENPQVPLRELRLHLFGGPRAPLATPSACGAYATHWMLSPWSGGAPVSGSAPMRIDQGCGGGGFDPKLTAGTTDPAAGSFSPFVLDLVRRANEQNVASLRLTLPPGLLAKLAGVPLCEGDAAASGGCPAASKVGSVAVASGPGTSPLWIPQPGKEPTAIYLSGPYKGAPYSLIVRVPAQAGPFNLGTVLVRQAIEVDPKTVRVSIVSDPLPQILEGVPVTYRTIHAEADRPDFTINPTSCEALSISARVSGSAGALAQPSSPFRARDCAGLPFKPRLDLALRGGTRRSQHPSLKAKLTMPRRGSNIALARVALPHSVFLDNSHIGTVCTRVQFAANQCPTGAVYGFAQAKSPLLERPLSGPVYLRSSNHPLPDLVADLNGQIEVELSARIDSVNGGIRSSFEAVPDAPVSEFTLTMQGGRKGLLQNSTNLCAATQRAIAQFRGQNGKRVTLKPILRNSCKKR